MKTEQPLPLQPFVIDDRDGRIRFKANKLVRHLLDFSSDRGCDLNTLQTIGASNEEHCQLAQLIGYSINGYSELDYVSSSEYGRALAAKEKFEQGNQNDHDCVTCATIRSVLERIAGGESIASVEREFDLCPGTVEEPIRAMQKAVADRIIGWASNIKSNF